MPSTSLGIILPVRFHLSIPARINVLGNPSDANEGDFATISAAVNVYAGALVEPSSTWRLEYSPRSALGPLRYAQILSDTRQRAI